jgi:hypothetical protein
LNLSTNLTLFWLKIIYKYTCKRGMKFFHLPQQSWAEDKRLS